MSKEGVIFLCNSVANFIILQPGMKIRSFILRFAAFFLILIFSQKAGAGLFYHDLFHKISSTELPPEHDKEISYSCTCIDDFLMPFAEAVTASNAAPVSKYITVAEVYKEFLPFQTSVHSSLRGPPAYIRG